MGGVSTGGPWTVGSTGSKSVRSCQTRAAAPVPCCARNPTRGEAARRGVSDSEGSKEKPRRLVFDKLVIDLDSFELIVDGKRVETPPKEMELLYHLASSPNRVYTRNQLLDEVWGFDYFGDSRTVDVHIKRLREKLEGVSDQWSLKTVWGVGYKFEVVQQ